MVQVADDRQSGRKEKTLVWRALWACMFVPAFLAVIVGELIPVYDYAWDDMRPERLDKDALAVARAMLQLAYIPTILSSALPVGSRVMRGFSVALGVIISVLLLNLPE